MRPTGKKTTEWRSKLPFQGLSARILGVTLEKRLPWYTGEGPIPFPFIFISKVSQPRPSPKKKHQLFSIGATGNSIVPSLWKPLAHPSGHSLPKSPVTCTQVTTWSVHNWEKSSIYPPCWSKPRHRIKELHTKYRHVLLTVQGIHSTVDWSFDHACW